MNIMVSNINYMNWQIISVSFNKGLCLKQVIWIKIVIVDDGTGNIIIYYEKEDFKRAALRRKKIDTKYNKCAKNIDIKSLKTQKCPKHLPNPRPKFIYSPETSISDIAVSNKM